MVRRLMETAFFRYKNGVLHCEEIAIPSIAQTVPTPFYLYSHAALLQAFSDYEDAFRSLNPLICFAMKANSNAAVLRSFVKQGAGVDVVSGGELFRAVAAGADPTKIVFSGVGKTKDEIAEALSQGILQFNVESVEELHAIEDVARSHNQKAPIALRVNPNVDPKTHPYISTGLKKNKFGIAWEETIPAYREAKALSHIDIVGVSCHIGSQLTDLTPLIDSLKKLKELVIALKQEGITLKNLDLGGGLGITYKDEIPPSQKDYAKAVEPLLRNLELRLILEPGRSLVGNAGILVTQVLYTKPGEGKVFAIVDAAMNDLMRPALYDAYHHIQPLVEKGSKTPLTTDVVGPVCETGDFLAKDRPLPKLAQGDLLAVMSAGAYGSAMSSFYNSRPLIAEVMVSESQFEPVRRRWTTEDLIKGEQIPAFLR